MSNTNGIASLTKSMNGIITISDGSGTVIENGVISTTGLTANNVLSAHSAATCSLFSNIDPSNIISVGNQSFPTNINLGEKLTAYGSGIDSRSTTER